MTPIAAIVPAAGSGSRFGGSENKIFQLLKGRAILLRTLDLFVAREDICQVLVCVSAADRETLGQRFGAELRQMNVLLVAGGDVRSESVRNALAALDPQAELVCIHDAVRPCVTQAALDAVFEAAAAGGAALLAAPVHGTVKKVGDDGIIERTLDRSGLWEAQTPQVFSPDVLRAAYENPDAATDDAHLVQATGVAVRVVPGDRRNVKITTPDDLAFAEAVFDSLQH